MFCWSEHDLISKTGGSTKTVAGHFPDVQFNGDGPFVFNTSCQDLDVSLPSLVFICRGELPVNQEGAINLNDGENTCNASFYSAST